MYDYYQTVVINKLIDRDMAPIESKRGRIIDKSFSTPQRIRLNSVGRSSQRSL